MFAAKFPVRDFQVAQKSTPVPSSNHCYRCAHYRKGQFGHTNKDLRNYLAFHCDKCQFWFCGICYSVVNQNRDSDEKCPGSCGTVTSAVQLITREWFPLKNIVLTTVSTNPTTSVMLPQPETGQPLTPPTLSLSVSQTEVNPEDGLLSNLTSIIQSLRTENNILKRKLSDVEESNKKKVDSIKSKFLKVLEESN